TGCCVTSDHFQERDWQLYDGDTALIYFHYIGLSSKLFSRLCSGENVDFPYREIFLHYRYLKHPEERPALQGKLINDDAPSVLGRLKRKIKGTLKV
ncbi:MAG: hypothetical protein AAGF75_03980, partial [Cyanobacteria bacterium P01_H01_bin.130]